MWYALQTSLSLEQEPHYWQEKSMGFQGAIFRRNVCLKLIICLMSFLSICLCPGFENTALNVGLYVALLMCAADLRASPLAMKGCLHLHSWQICSLCEGRQRKGTRPYKWSWFIPALVQGAVLQAVGVWRDPWLYCKDGRRVNAAPCTQLSQHWRGALWEGMQLGHAGLKAVPVALVDWEQKDVLSMDTSGKQGYLPSLSTRAWEPRAEQKHENSWSRPKQNE